MGILEEIWAGIGNFFEHVINFICDVIDGILNFFNDVVDWFKKKFLQKGRHIPFIGDKNKIKDMLKTAPVKDVGLFKGIYDQQTDEITDMAVVEADELDAQTKEVLGNDALVVLS
ncbi:MULTISPECIES: hypothetical protein [unclassified Bacteroides]|uniref:hypothetical protein n=1 Tax=unclassified Bacteroides TaxID=2646097 RepID=UPI0004E2097F|nr:MULTISPECIES: hypothetical protein [unclassified Bacteroides]